MAAWLAATIVWVLAILLCFAYGLDETWYAGPYGSFKRSLWQATGVAVIWLLSAAESLTNYHCALYQDSEANSTISLQERLNAHIVQQINVPCDGESYGDGYYAPFAALAANETLEGQVFARLRDSLCESHNGVYYAVALATLLLQFLYFALRQRELRRNAGVNAALLGFTSLLWAIWPLFFRLEYTTGYHCVLQRVTAPVAIVSVLHAILMLLVWVLHVEKRLERRLGKPEEMEMEPHELRGSRREAPSSSHSRTTLRRAPSAVHPQPQFNPLPGNAYPHSAPAPLLYDERLSGPSGARHAIQSCADPSKGSIRQLGLMTESQCYAPRYGAKRLSQAPTTEPAMGKSEKCWQGIDISGSGFLACAINVLCVVFYGVGLGTRRWSVADPDETQIRGYELGLFEYCSRRCQPYLDNQFEPTGQTDLNMVTRTEATAAFLVLAILATFAAIVLIIFGLGRKGYHVTMNHAAMLTLGAGVLGLIGICIFAAMENELPSKFHKRYSFYLPMVAGMLNLVAGGLLSIDSKNISYRSPEDAVRRGGAGMI
ncbi:uncharacterized protein MONBRDRAFT_34814 [Monosiga brevicollis MX1]|uniref:G-protein coupled receptors family 3 profile domain-containing protein n=1 Tax=Monosiga brevicollis TaxID=81824 RepID=A9VEC0_MONBE|nr:uncharacterized protein MONBRDRAFT_34814 [Monosiga brevicollis MX1]EDQ84119.1 predicted protein [Monosiga brevicollis MX1]|eukprot:XP_001751067.1 hypothetical protein [Monosiga brevicollis MX1]